MGKHGVGSGEGDITQELGMNTHTHTTIYKINNQQGPTV